MFSPRWSTFSLLALLLMAGAMAFYAGRSSIHPRPVSNPAAAPPSEQSQNVQAAAQTIQLEPLTETQSWDSKWLELSRRLRTPALEGDLVTAIEQLAEHDPQRGLSLATTEGNFRLRAALLRAALQGWGKTDPESAAAWVQTETVLDKDQAASAMLHGAMANPGQAASVAALLMQNDPGHAAQYGSDLIWTFADAGQFSQAATFAANGPEANRDDWMLAAYSRWAEFQPQSAMSSALQLPDSPLKATAVNAAIVGWSPTDPQGMAEFALKNLAADQQSSALSRALTFWAESDPAAAAAWINQKNPGASSDPGVAEIAMSPQLAQSPDVATSWAKAISDPNLRSRTLATILHGWLQSNPAAARKYLEASPDLQSDDLASLQTEMNNP